MQLKISEYLKPEAIIMEIKAREKIAAINELVAHMVKQKLVGDGEEFIKALAKRERISLVASSKNKRASSTLLTIS